MELRKAYSDFSVTFRFLQSMGWSDLLNLGYFRYIEMPFFLFLGYGYFQRKLAKKSISLLSLKSTDIVVDVACGYGWASHQMAKAGAEVTGIDLLPEHVEKARRKFKHDNLKFEVFNALELSKLFPVASVSKIHCLEAAFHFGIEGRQTFLKEAYRILKPGGRLVLVDFVWQEKYEDVFLKFDQEGYFRRTWQLEDFDKRCNYLKMLKIAGFEDVQVIDWTERVTRKIIFLSRIVIFAGNNKLFRLLVKLLRPQLFSLSEADWQELIKSFKLHYDISSRTDYIAIIAKK